MKDSVEYFLRDWNQEAWASSPDNDDDDIPVPFSSANVLQCWPLPFSTEKKVTGRGSCLDIKVGHWKKEKNSRANNLKGNKKIVEKVFRPPGQKGKNKIKWGGDCVGVGWAWAGHRREFAGILLLLKY